MFFQRLAPAIDRFPPLVRDSMVSMSVRVVGLGLAFLSHLVLSRALGAQSYGIYVIGLSWAMILAIPARLGLDNAALRFATVYREEGRFTTLRGFVITSLAAIGIASVIIAAIMAGLKMLQPALLDDVAWGLLWSVAALLVPLALLGWAAAMMRTANRIFEAQFYEQVLRPFLLIVAVGAAWAAGRAIDSVDAMIVTAASAGFALAAIGVRLARVYQPIRNQKASFVERRLWLTVSGVMLLQALAQELLNQLDILLLGALADATAAAHFSAAWRLASLVPFGLVAIVTVSGPRIASAHRRGDQLEMANIAKVNARFSLLFAIGVAAVIVLIGRPVLAAFGPSFGNAYVPLLVLLLGGLVNAFTGSVGYYLLMTGRQKAALGIVCIALGVSFGANVWLIPRFGVLGAAMASTLCVATWNLLMLAYVRKTLGIDASAVGLAPRMAG